MTKKLLVELIHYLRRGKMLIGDLIKELERFAPSLQIKIFKDGVIYDFEIDDCLIDRVDLNVIESR